ncbi:MAG: CHAT domain-containing protein [Symploca sp. SIO3C6]|nr:CHAT domain-containing protein [Symploca sp. SIO3C6]
MVLRSQNPVVGDSYFWSNGSFWIEQLDGDLGKFFSSNDHKGELLRANDLDRLLRDRTNTNTIDLLILSACKTAQGDNRATLGLARLAVQAGAQSTLATLWQVSDASTVKLMKQFYKGLSQPGTTNAEALRHAQVTLLQNLQYQTPYSWGAYILVGN